MKQQRADSVEKFTIPNKPGCLPGQRTPDVVCWCPPFINILCNCVDTVYNALPIWTAAHWAAKLKLLCWDQEEGSGLGSCANLIPLSLLAAAWTKH